MSLSVRATALALLAALLIVGCGVTGLDVSARSEGHGGLATPIEKPEPRASGSVSVAYPDVPSRWVVPSGDDPAATDLAALWGLPLFRTDPHGRLVEGLVEDVEQEQIDHGGLRIVLSLRAGQWSDGEPVTAEDVVATLGALRESPVRATLAALREVTVRDTRTVALDFDRAYARWPWLLSEIGGVLPAHVLAERGLEAYASEVPVSGGWFRLEGEDRGRSARFVAHREGPLGPPRLESIDVLFTPAYETALGLLQDGRADLALGYLALNPLSRAREVDGVEAGGRLGGTWVGMQWRRDGPLGAPDDADRRRAFREAVDVRDLVEGLLGESGEVATSPVPGIPGPVAQQSAGGSPPSAVMVMPRWQEALAFTARALQGDIEAQDETLEIVARETPDLVDVARSERTLALRIFRDSPRPSLVSLVGEEAQPVALAADATASADDPAAMQVLAEDAYVQPLYRIAVAHAWRSELAGVEPSSWPGLAFAGAGDWHVASP